MALSVKRVRIGNAVVGLTGFTEILESLGPSLKESPRSEIESALLAALKEKNYVPAAAEEEYRDAVYREFLKFHGESCEDALSGHPVVEVLGQGCAQCDRIERDVMEVVQELGIEASVDHVRDIREIARYGVMGTPALVVDGKVMCVGRAPTKAKIKEWLMQAKDRGR